VYFDYSLPSLFAIASHWSLAVIVDYFSRELPVCYIRLTYLHTMMKIDCVFCEQLFAKDSNSISNTQQQKQHWTLYTCLYDQDQK